MSYISVSENNCEVTRCHSCHDNPLFSSEIDFMDSSDSIDGTSSSPNNKKNEVLDGLNSSIYNHGEKGVRSKQRLKTEENLATSMTCEDKVQPRLGASVSIKTPDDKEINQCIRCSYSHLQNQLDNGDYPKYVVIVHFVSISAYSDLT